MRLLFEGGPYMGKYGISYFHHVYVISIISMYYLSDLISIWIAWNGRGSPLEIDQQYCLLKKKINSRVKIFFNWHWNGLDCFLQNFTVRDWFPWKSNQLHSSISAVLVSAIFNLTTFIILSYFPPLLYYWVTSIYVVFASAFFLCVPILTA